MTYRLMLRPMGALRRMLLLTLLLSPGGCTLSNGQHVDVLTCELQ